MAADQTHWLTELAARAQARFDALPPAEQARVRQQQRISWARGELMLAHPKLSYAEATRRVEEAARKLEEDYP